MDVAEDVRNSGTVEHHISRRTRFIKTEVEPLSLEKRKDIVKEGIAVGKFHYRPDWHDQEVRIKALVMLCQPQAISRVHKRLGRRGLRAWHLRKPNHRFRSVWRFRICSV